MSTEYAWTSPEGHDIRFRVDGPSTHIFTYDDGSVLTVTQNANGERTCQVTRRADAGESSS